MSLIKHFKKLERPTNYYFQDPDSKHEYPAFPTLPELVKHIEQYRSQNKLSALQAPKETIENYLCNRPENEGKCETVPLRRGWYTYIKGGVALFEMLLFKKIVDQPEAERRARICATCDNNVFPEETNFDKWADNLAEASTGGRVTSLNKQLGICSVCQCCLRSAVWEGGKADITKEQRLEMEKVGCWKPRAV